jgi:hypothetical protein
MMGMGGRNSGNRICWTCYTYVCVYVGIYVSSVVTSVKDPRWSRHLSSCSSLTIIIWKKGKVGMYKTVFHGGPLEEEPVSEVAI